MSTAEATAAPVRHADRFFIGGEWVAPSSDATVDVIDSTNEEVYYTIAANLTPRAFWFAEILRA